MGKHYPSHERIADYWRSAGVEIAPEWTKAHRHCWRCGVQFKTYNGVPDFSNPDGGNRCHIIADARGGSLEPSNFVLLCRQCHIEAPSVPDPGCMWDWIQATMFYCDRLGRFLRQAFQEYEWMYGPLPAHAAWLGWLKMLGLGSLFAAPSGPVSAIEDEFVEGTIFALLPALKLVEGHSGRVSGSSAAWAFRQAFLWATGDPDSFLIDSLGPSNSEAWKANPVQSPAALVEHIRSKLEADDSAQGSLFG